MPDKGTGPKPEKTLASKYVFKGRSLKVRVDSVLTAEGRKSTREIVEKRDFVAVVAVDADDNILLVNQFRTALGKNLLEIPAGGIEKGEDIAATVIREMQEETGLKPGKVVRLTGFYTTPGFSAEYGHLYLATDLVHAPLRAEDTAGIELVRVPLVQILEFITSGKIQDSKSIAGLLYYLEYRKKHQ
ncbi:MAG: NUDIX hydrolase [Dehalococcoidales bacterium]